MSGVRYDSQINMKVTPTEDNHVVRLKDLLEYLSGLVTSPVTVVTNSPLEAAWTFSSATGEFTALTTDLDAITYDGVSLSDNDRILLTGQVDKTQNGIYLVTVSGTNTILVRADDMSDSDQLKQGIIVPVTFGDDNGGTRWKLSLGSMPATLGTTDLIFNKEVVDFSKVDEMTFLLEGDDDTTEYIITHNWNTLNVLHELYDATTLETVNIEFKRVSVNAVQVVLGEPLGDGNDLVLVIHSKVVK